MQTKMSGGNSVKSCSQSNKTIWEPYVVERCHLQTNDTKSLLHVTNERSNDAKEVDSARLKLNSTYGTHFDFAPWFGLDCLKQTATGSSHSTSELKKALNNPQTKKEMVLKCDKVYHYNHSDQIIILDEEESEMFKDSSLEDISENERTELRKRMLGHFD